MRIRTCLLGLILLLAGCVSGEEEPTGKAVSSEEAVVVDAEPVAKPKIICKKERVIGSAIPQKVCRTRAQMEAQEEEARRTMNQIRGGANANNSAP